MFLTGTLNTITNKAADQTGWSHPFLQTIFMFVGEMLCLAAFGVYWLTTPSEKRDKIKEGFSPWILALPALCDMTASTMMNIGLLMTSASVYQMLRGSVIIFTSIASVVFLKRKLKAHHWIGIVLVVIGTAIVGSEFAICPPKAGNKCKGAVEGDADKNAITGNIIVILAQIIVATQMVVEEKFIGGWNLPALLVVGMEGVFGFVMLSSVTLVLNFLNAPYFITNPSICLPSVNNTGGDPVIPPVPSHGGTVQGLQQFSIGWVIAVANVGNIFSIAFFNYFGVSVTKHMSAATRTVVDSLRTILIWGISLALGWEHFCWIEIIGFVILLSGNIIYNKVIKIPGLNYDDAPAAVDDSQKDLLLGGEGDDYLIESSSLNSAATIIDHLQTPSMSKATTVKQR